MNFLEKLLAIQAENEKVAQVVESVSAVAAPLFENQAELELSAPQDAEAAIAELMGTD